MGQRHQIFVRIPNPVKNFYGNAEVIKKLEKEFGTADTTILAYHNQWLYGRSAISNCLRLLKFSSQFSKSSKINGDAFEGYDCPFTIKGQKNNFDTIDKITEGIAFIMNFRPVKTTWLDAGIGSSRYIGKEDEGIREDFTLGDNNDGITIVDLIENKYCFMNIYEHDKKAEHGISSLPMLKPLNARAYVSAYYGETIETTNPFYFGDHDRSKVTKTKQQQQKIVNANIKINDKAFKGFEKFEVLTLAEVQTMFTKMKLVKKPVTAPRTKTGMVR